MSFGMVVLVVFLLCAIAAAVGLGYLFCVFSAWLVRKVYEEYVTYHYKRRRG